MTSGNLQSATHLMPSLSYFETAPRLELVSEGIVRELHPGCHGIIVRFIKNRSKLGYQRDELTVQHQFSYSGGAGP